MALFADMESSPTMWNFSPLNMYTEHGQDALINATIRDIDNPVEIGHIVRALAHLSCGTHLIQLRQQG